MSERQRKRALATNSPAWLRIRAYILNRQPMCQAPGCKQPATEVDHIDGRSEHLHDYRHENLQGLCKPCHSSKTTSTRMGGSTQPRGCDEDGTPYRQMARA